MLMAMDTRSASHASLDRALGTGACRPRVRGVGDRLRLRINRKSGEQNSLPSSRVLTSAGVLGCYFSRTTLNRLMAARSVFSAEATGLLVIDAAPQVLPVPRVARVEPSNVSARLGEFYSEFYRGAFFVVASISQVAVFTGGKWWAV